MFSTGRNPSLWIETHFVSCTDQGTLACPFLSERVIWPPIDSEAPITLAPAIGFPLMSTMIRSGPEQPARSSAEIIGNTQSLIVQRLFIDNVRGTRREASRQ